MQRRFSDWVDDPRIVTLLVTVLVAAALWVATWSVMGRMDMGAMGMADMDMGSMTSGEAMPDDGEMDMSGETMTGGTGMEMSGETMTGGTGMEMSGETMTGSTGMEMSGETMTGGTGMEMSGEAMTGGTGMEMSGEAMTGGTGMEMSGETMTGGTGMEMSGSGSMDGMSSMDGMDMWGMSMDPTDWSAKTIFEASLMWMLMMAAMMLPAMAPVMAIYSGIAAKEDNGARLAARILLFTLGYFVLWALFSIALALVQLGLRGSSFFTMGGTQATPLAAAALMVIAGLYQLSPIKDACLKHCRHPLMYLMTHWREGLAGAFQVGANHGVYCVGCCCVFMGLMFVFGAMNVWWMAVIALYFLAEKIAPEAERWGRWTGYALIIGGLGVAVYQGV